MTMNNTCVCCGGPILPAPEYAEFVLCADCVRLLEDDAPLVAAQAVKQKAASQRKPLKIPSWHEANWYRLQFPFSRN